jgi:S-adenosylmethionine:tRNA ribosyltransferase-isomerase
VSLVADRVPELAEAASPIEARGLSRDSVRLLEVLLPHGETRDMRFDQLPELLEPADVLVINTSGTRPSAVGGRRDDGRRVAVHLSSPVPGAPAGAWIVELREGDRSARDGAPGERLALPDGGRAHLISQYHGDRLWLATLSLPEEVDEYLTRHGYPIRYGHTAGERSIDEYQNVYATEPGSAEMPSAGRPFTPELITRLVARGIGVAPLVLHTGVSSLEQGERPHAERFRVPASTTERVEVARRLGGRVIAVGTTVVRALESSVSEDGRLHPAGGWTDLVLDRGTPAKVVDGILTGFHDPHASHLDLLQAIVPPEVLAASYRAAAAAGYRRHEFGDVQLILPRSRANTLTACAPSSTTRLSRGCSSSSPSGSGPRAS